MSVIKSINSFLWNGPMLILLLGTHIYFTCKSGFIQKHIFHAIKLSVTPCPDGAHHAGRKPAKHPSSFSALATTLAATLGTGNIVGVSTAVACGGPGAVFWCWITGVLGMATTYAECYLGIRYRIKNSDGSFSGGPMYALQNGLNSKILAKIFCIATILASCGMGCSTQARSVTEAVSTQFGVSPYFSGFLLAIAVGMVILGGIRTIGRLCTGLVPALTLFYIGGCLILLIINIEYLLPATGVIIRGAFTPQSMAGGLIGGSFMSSARFGVARGLFTNEAGLGSAAITAADVNCRPDRQALVSMSATFWDTVVMCAVTGIVIVSSLLAAPTALIGYSGNELTTVAFLQLGSAGPVILTIALCGFAVATLIGWSYFAEKAAFFLMGETGKRLYHIVYIVMIYVGSIISLDYVWELSDLANALMAIPNLIALILLRDDIKIADLTA